MVRKQSAYGCWDASSVAYSRMSQYMWGTLSRDTFIDYSSLSQWAQNEPWKPSWYCSPDSHDWSSRACTREETYLTFMICSESLGPLTCHHWEGGWGGEERGKWGGEKEGGVGREGERGKIYKLKKKKKTSTSSFVLCEHRHLGI